jgi:hypothetical protein
MVFNHYELTFKGERVNMSYDPISALRMSKWAKEESGAIKRYLSLLSIEGSLQNLRSKSYMSRATYYRNLKYCQEKGYIVDGKLVRKVWYKH